MKSTIVPAQITSVEDRVTGNLTLTQLVLVSVPIFFVGLLITVIPPALHISIFKIVLCAVVYFSCAALAIRMNGDIVLHWLRTIARYNRRPRYYVYDRNSLASRCAYVAPAATSSSVAAPSAVTHKPNVVDIPVKAWDELEKLLEDQKTNIHFETDKKGALYARLYETN